MATEGNVLQLRLLLVKQTGSEKSILVNTLINLHYITYLGFFPQGSAGSHAITEQLGHVKIIWIIGETLVNHSQLNLEETVFRLAC